MRITPRARHLLSAVAVGVLGGLIGSAGPAAAQPATIIRWDFNDGTTNPQLNLGGGTPQITLLGGTTAAFVAQGNTNGAVTTDPNAAGTAYNLTNYPAQGAASGTAGVQFTLPTTAAGGGAGFDDLVFRFDQRNSGTANRFFEFQYTLDGTNFLTFEQYTAGGVDSFFTRTIDLTGLAGANNNPNFAVRMVSVFDPATGAYAPTNGASAYAPTGTVRYDQVTLSRAAVWQGGSGGNDVAAAANYTRGVAPAAADTVVFGATANTAVSVPASAQYGQFLFRANAPAHTVTIPAGQTLTLGVGVVSKSAATQTFNGAVAFAGAATIQSDGGTTVFNGGITLPAASGLQLTGTGTTVLFGTYTGNDLTLSAGRTLAGVGTINNEVHNFGGTVRGGVADGTNDFGTLTVNASGDLEIYTAPGNRAPTIQVSASRNGPGAAVNSLLAVTGGSGADLELNDAGIGANQFRIQLLAANLVLGETYALTILTTDSTGSIEFNNVGQAGGSFIPTTAYVLESPNVPVFSNVTLQVVDNPNSTLVLTFTPVPEPATVTLVGAAGLAAVAGVRRRLRPAA